jgi:hypothetical protein
MDLFAHFITRFNKFFFVFFFKKSLCIRGHSLYGSPQPSFMYTRTRAAERQDPDFLIDPRNKKQRKKRSAVKILHSPFQITS